MGPGSSYKWGQKSHNPYKWQSKKKGFTGVKKPGVISPPFITRFWAHGVFPLGAKPEFTAGCERFCQSRLVGLGTLLGERGGRTVNLWNENPAPVEVGSFSHYL